jgi:hypothetical protein
VTKAQVGLGNVDNTSDANKPVSTAMQTALNEKQNTLTFDGTYDAATNKAATVSTVTSAVSTKQDALSQSQLAAVNSGITAAKMTADEAALVELVDSGAKNLLLNKHSVGNVTETNGFRFTPQSDGGIKIESIGTHSANGDYYIQGDWGGTVTVLDLSDDTYTATMSSETTESDRGIRLRIYGANNTRIINDLPLNDEINFTGEVKFIFITVISTAVIPSDGIVVYPMICTAADYSVSTKFVPYRPSWQEMWDMIQALQNGTRSAPALAKAEPDEINKPETGEEEETR